MRLQGFMLVLLANVLTPENVSAACTLPACIQVLDTNADGDLTAEFQAAVNSAIYPGGFLTSQTKVAFEAPPPGSYVISDTVRICYDDTPPILGGETSEDCTGVDSQGLLPEIRMLGGWDQVTLRCIFDAPRAYPRTQPAYGCLHLGDSFNDATFDDIGPLVDIELSLNMAMEKDGFELIDFEHSVNAVLCDGCTGLIDGHYTVGGAGTPPFTFNIQALHLVGPNLRISGTYDFDPNATLLHWTNITFDGDIQDSGIQGYLSSTATIMIGSVPITRNGPLDGCAWGAYDQPCRGWRLYPNSTLYSRDGYVGALWFGEWEDVHFDGVVDHATREEAKQSVRGHRYDVKSAINFNEISSPFFPIGTVDFTGVVHGSVHFDGTCIDRGIINPCIRMFNSETKRDPNFPTVLYMNGLIDRSDLLAPPLEIGSANATGGFVAAAGADVIIGPNFRYEGANFGHNLGINTAHLFGEAETPLSLNVNHSGPIANLPACVSTLSGTLVPCAKPETKILVENNSYLGVTEMTVNANVGANTSCDLRWRVAGDCTDCEFIEIGEQVFTTLHEIDDAASDPEWSFWNLSATDDSVIASEPNGVSLRLETLSAAPAFVTWSPPEPINLRREYLMLDIWTDPSDVLDPQSYTHAQFTESDGLRLVLFDDKGSVSRWFYGGAGGSGTKRFGLGDWSLLYLQHWFEDPTSSQGQFDFERVSHIRVLFNTVNSASGRVLRIDKLRTLLREGNEFRYGYEETGFGNFRDYRTQQLGDIAMRQLSGRVPAGRVLQLQVDSPRSNSCAAGTDCTCDAVSAIVETALIEVADHGHHFDRIAPGFEKFPAPCGSGFSSAFLVVPVIYLRRRWHKRSGKA